MIPRTHESITLLPVFHGRLEFAGLVRQALLAAPPQVVAVELPGTWREPLLQAVNRLPYLSLILGEDEGAPLFLPVEPTDPSIEALRTARELGLPVECIDLDVERYPLHGDPLPDSYALRRLGHDAFLEAFYRDPPAPGPLDAQRETMMAHALQRLAAGGTRVTAVIGAAHLPGLLARLAVPQPRPLGRVKARALRLCNWSEKSSREFMTEAPFLAAAYERARRGETAPDGAGSAGPDGAPHGSARAEAPGAGSAEAPVVAMSAPMAGLDREAASEAIVREAAAAHAQAYGQALTPQQLRQIGTFAKKYALRSGLLVPDLYQLIVAGRGVVDDDFAYQLWELGSAYPWQDGSGLLPTLDLEEQFATLEGRRLTLRRRLRRPRPRLRQYVHKQRMREQFGGRWKAQWSGRAICSHPPEDVVLEDYGRYLKHKAKGLLSASRTRVAPFSVSLLDGIDVRETLRNWHEHTLYVREVLTLGGDFGSVVVIFDEDRTSAEASDSAGAARDAPGSPPTLRAVPGGTAGRGADGAGGAPEAADERYPWRVTWIGESEQESDMAFYASAAGEEVVGPGISRCEYGGFLLSYPPGRLLDVWNDPVFRAAHDKPETLLLAGLDYSRERNVLYVAPRPPRPWVHSLAARLGHQVTYLPLGQLSPGTVKKMRAFHVLDGHHVRAYAEQYIRKG